MILENDFVCLNIELENSCFSIHSKVLDAELANIRINVDFSVQGRKQNSLRNNWGLYSWRKTSIEEISTADEVVLTLGPDEFDIHYVLRFKLPENGHAVQWNLTLINQSSKPIWLDRISLLDHIADSRKKQRDLSFLGIRNSKFRDQFFYSNGWQSWSGAGVIRGKTHQYRTRFRPFLAARTENYGTITDDRAGHYWSDFYAAYGDNHLRVGAVLGFLSQKQNFGSIAISTHPGSPADVKMWANGDSTRIDPGSSFETDWAYFEYFALDEDHPLDRYLTAVSAENGCGEVNEAPTGWCSWYQYFQEISEPIIIQNTKALSNIHKFLPLQIVQTDDGFIKKIGDWYDLSSGFNNGLAGVSKLIKDNNFTPGLWLAPYILQSDAQIQREHPDFILKGYDNQPVNAGFGWNGLTKALDLTHPGVHDHICKLIDTAVHQWGYEYLKLDFIYAGALKGKRLDPTKSRAQALHASLASIREIAGKQTYLVGCGCPMGSGIGILDALRITTDISSSWEPEFAGLKGVFNKEESMPSAKFAIRNMLTRSHLHKKWWNNDPDCIQLRENLKLTAAERQSHITAVALTGGSFFISDDLKKLAPAVVQNASSLLPIIDRRPVIVDLWENSFPKYVKLALSGAAGEWFLLGYINWSDRKEKVSLESDHFKLLPINYFVRSYWDEQCTVSKKSELLWSGIIQPHGAVMLAVRPFTQAPTYLGGSLHISQGLEVDELELSIDGCKLNFDVNYKGSGYFDMFLPDQPTKVLSGDHVISFKSLNDFIYRIQLPLDHQPSVNISY